MIHKKYTHMKRHHTTPLPTEEQKINYIYGLMNAEEKRQFENLLEQSPELSIEITEMKQLLEAMQELPEVDAPELHFFQNNKEKSQPNSLSKQPIFNKFTQSVMTLAASIAFLMIVGALTHTQISINQSGFLVHFGKQSAQTPVTQNQLHEVMIGLQDLRKGLHAISTPVKAKTTQTQDISKEIESLKAAIIQLNQHTQTIAKNPSTHSPAVTQKIHVSEAQLKQILSVLSVENTKLIQQAFQTANAEQQRQLEETLQNFAFYLNAIREEDMQSILAGLEELNRKSEIKSNETDQAIDALYQSLQSRNTQ